MKIESTIKEKLKSVGSIQNTYKNIIERQLLYKDQDGICPRCEEPLNFHESQLYRIYERDADSVTHSVSDYELRCKQCL